MTWHEHHAIARMQRPGGGHARAKRLGWQVMAALLEAVAGPLAGEEQDRALVAGMRLVAVDGMCLDLPDNEENGAEFGYPGNDAGRGPFPQIRVVGLAECGTRALLGAATSPLATGEQPLARQLLPKLRPGDLLLADRNFLSHGLLADVLAAGVHVLWRAKSDVDLPVLQVLPDGTYLSRIADPAASRRLRRKGVSGGDIPGITVRVIEYSVTSEDGSETSETFTLITDIPDPALLSPGQAAAAYASRWQLETCFDELETSMRGGAAVVLRSKSPPMIRQEIYAMLCCYQAIVPDQPRRETQLDRPHLLYPRARIRSRIDSELPSLADSRDVVLAMASRPRLIAHAAIESYSVLTRLPPPHRAHPSIVHAFITERFTEPFLTLSGTGY